MSCSVHVCIILELVQVKCILRDNMLKRHVSNDSLSCK